MTLSIARGLAAIAAAVSAAGLIAPAIAGAAQCGPGTVYDAPTDRCVVAPPADPVPPAEPAQWQAPPPPPPPPPLPAISICLPIPFVPVCFPVS